MMTYTYPDPTASEIPIALNVGLSWVPLLLFPEDVMIATACPELLSVLSAKT
jgi:hypothetical protein